MSNTIKLNKLFDFSFMPKEGEHCVYCLFNSDDVCIYVGQTGNLDGRVYSHFKDGKDFVQFSFDVCEISKASELEARTIVKMNPTLNKTLPTNESYISTISLRNDISKLLLDNEENLKVVFSGAEFSKAKKKKYVTVEYYNKMISCISEFFDLDEEEA